MTTTFTTNLGLIVMTPGDPAVRNVWGANLDNGLIQLLDQGIAGIFVVDVTTLAGYPDAVPTSTQGAVDQSRNAHFKLTGTLTSNSLVLFPAGRARNFTLDNETTGAFTLAIGVNNGSGGALGTTVTVPQGQSMFLLSDGTNVTNRFNAFSGNVTINGSLNVTGSVAPSTPVAPSGGGTGQTSYTDGQLLIGNSVGNTLTKSTLTAGANVTITNGHGSITISASGGGGSGTVTSVGTGTGLTGGPITSSGAIALAPIANGAILANLSGITAPPLPNFLSSIFDSVLGATQGQIIFRGGSLWGVLNPGTNGQVLMTRGAGVNPIWGTGDSQVKAWVVFDGSGTVLNSFNVSSVAKSGTGTFIVNFTAGLTNPYAVLASVDDNAGSGATIVVSAGSESSGSVTVRTLNAAFAADPGRAFVAICGTT